jgi:DNA polymerase-1
MACPPSAIATSPRWWGRPSDNLPGVPGVGPKTAAKWITQRDGDLTGIVAHIDQIKGKVGDALRAHLDQVLRNRRLNQLVRDLDTGVGLDELQRHHVGPRKGARGLRRPGVPRPARAAVRDLRHGGWRPTAVSRWTVLSGVLCRRVRGAVAGRARRPGAHRGARRRVVGPGHRRRGGLGAAPTREEAAYVDLCGHVDPADDAALAAWLADERPEDPARRQGAAARAASRTAGTRWWGWSRTRRSRRTWPARTSATIDLADLVLRYLGRELRAETAGRKTAMLDFGADDAGRALMRCRPGAGGAGPLGTELAGRGAGRPGGTELLQRRGAAARRTCSPRWSRRASPWTSRA